MPHTSHPFAHRVNNDDTVDSICKTCFMTIGNAVDPEGLKSLEAAHVCDPWNLEVIEAALTGKSLFVRQPKV